MYSVKEILKKYPNATVDDLYAFAEGYGLTLTIKIAEPMRYDVQLTGEPIVANPEGKYQQFEVREAAYKALQAHRNALLLRVDTEHLSDKEVAKIEEEIASVQLKLKQLCMAVDFSTIKQVELCD